MTTRKTLSDYPAVYQKQIGRQLHGTPAAILATPRPDVIAVEGKATPRLRQARKGQRFTVAIEPMGKPRMTQRDKWKQRPVVMRYRAYADKLRAMCLNIEQAPVAVSWTAYFSIPGSWPLKKRKAMAGQPHRAKPDRDNIDKGIMDALWQRDEGIACGTLCKLWDDGLGARIEIEVDGGGWRIERVLP